MGLKQPRQESLVKKISQLEKTISELQEQVQAHKQTQAMLARAERIAHVGSWEWDIDSDEVTWSDGLYRIFQLDPAEKPGRWAEHGEYTHPEDMARLRQASFKAKTDGIPYELVIRTFRKDGETRWCLARGFPEKGADGRVERLFGTVQDITERREAETERDEYDSLLSSTLSAVDSLLMVIDKNHRILLSNWKDHEWIPESRRRDNPRCYQVMKNLEAPCRQCPAEQTFLDGRHRRYEEVSPIDGRHKEISLTPILNHKGQVAYVLKNVRDVTQQKAAEEALRMQALTLNQIQDRITVTDLEGNITYVNDAECAMLGKSREELIGENVTVYGEDSRKGATQAEILETTLRQGAWRGEVVNFDAAGNRLILDCRTHLVRNEAGEPIALCGIGTDITERRRSEKEKAFLEQRFHHAQKLDSIGRLAGGAAHDLNNLLAPILGYGRILLDDMESDDHRREAVEDIMSAGGRARDLVRQLLAFGRKQTLNFQEVDLNRLLTGYEKLLRRTIREDIAITRDLDPELPLVRGDAGQLEQVIMNLAINAQDAMIGGGSLSISTAAVELGEDEIDPLTPLPAGCYVRLKFEDTGCGMDEFVLENIFEPFYTTKEDDQGTGLGLATVYGIVKQHGGEVLVSSRPGQGSTFTVLLPVAGDGEVL